MFNEKQLTEERNDKISAMEKIIANAESDNRLPSDEETTEFNNLKAEVAKINSAIQMQKDANDMSLTKVLEPATNEAAKQKQAFAKYLRGVVQNDTDSPMTKDNGQATIPSTIWSEIIAKVVDICPVYDWATKYNVKGSFTIPKDGDGNLTVAYNDEFEDLTSGNLVISSVTLGGFLAGALTKISKSLVNNSQFDIVAYVVEKMAEKISSFIEHEILIGTNQKIEGLRGVTEDMTVTAAAASAITADELMDTQDKVADKFQAKSYWVMSRSTRNAIRKLKDTEGNYLLNRDFSAKWGYSLLGRDVYVSDQMDDIGAGKTAIYYGDFSGVAINIHENASIEVLREKYATQHAIGVTAWLEMDAKLADTQKVAKLALPAASAQEQSMIIKALTSFCGPISMHAGEVREVNDSAALDLIAAGHAAEFNDSRRGAKPAAEPKRKTAK